MDASRLRSEEPGNKVQGNCILLGFLVSVIITLYFIFSPHQHLGFLGPVFFFIILVIFSTIGIILGDAFRKFTRPDTIYTRDSMQTFSQKIYWWIGPQCTGYFIGLVLTILLFKSVFHYAIMMGAQH